MNKNWLILFLTGAVYSAAAQSVSGKLTDETGNGVPYSAVALILAGDSSVVKGTITNDGGGFIFNDLRPANYKIKADLPGFRLFYSEAFIADSLSSLDLPPVKLTSSGINLNEISVSTVKKAVEFKNGNITVNIENSALATGNTAYDLLTRLPGVTLDRINNTISIQGREGVKILIDGRVQQLSENQLINLLKSISASSIEKIEVLKNPPLEYDSEGTAGMINIKTKKVKLFGFSGTVTSSASQGFYARGESGLTLNYKARKFTLFSNVFSEYGKYIYNNNFNRRITYKDVTTSFDQKHTQREFDRGVEANVGLDWLINSKTILGFKVTLDPGKSNSYTKGNALLSDTTNGYNNLEYRFIQPNTWFYQNYNLNAEHSLDTSGGKISFSSDFSPNHELISGNFDNRFFIGSDPSLAPVQFKASVNEKIFLATSKVDLQKKITPSLNFKSGLKYSRQQLLRHYNFLDKNNSTGDFVMDTTYSNTFKYNEQISAGYIQLEKELGDFNFQLGVRAEHTLINGSSPGRNFTLSRNYFNLFPLLMVEFEPNENNSFQVSYNQRINRPDAYSYIPYKFFWNNFLSSEVGNAELMPEYSKTIEFTHTFMDGLSNSVAYSRLNNFLMPYTLQNDSTREITGYQVNLKTSSIIGYNFFVEAPIKNWLEINAEFQAAYKFYSGEVEGVDYSSTAIGYEASLGTIFLLKKDTKVEVEGEYIGPNPMGVFTVQPRWALNFALKKSLFKNKLDVAIGVDDLFYTLIGRNQVNFQNQNWKISETYDSRRIRISLAYNFGKIKVEKRSTASNEEERQKLKH